MHTASRGMKELCMYYLKLHILNQVMIQKQNGIILGIGLQISYNSAACRHGKDGSTCASVKLTLITLFRMLDLEQR